MEQRKAFLPKTPFGLFQMKPSRETITTLPEIQTLFPYVSKLPLLEMTQTPCLKKKMKVGVFFSGGQASGGHNVIAGLLDTLETSLIGFLGGPSGLLEGKYQELTCIDRFRNTGGFHLLGSGRTKIETKEQLEQALKKVTELSLEGLVVIGGDDSNTNAAILAEFFHQRGCATKVIGVPKTIDGDLQNRFVPISFGFDSACRVYKELIGNLFRDCLSDQKYYHFIRLMGRSASHITLECALATHPTYALISEEVAKKQLTLEQIISKLADLVEARYALGKSYGVILIPEGLLEFIPNALDQDLLKDPHGNVHLSSVDTERLLANLTAKELEKRSFKGKFSTVCHFFGYEGRSGYPSNFDANYSYGLGQVAASLIHAGASGYMSFISHLEKPSSYWKAGGVPLASLMRLEKRHGALKPVIEKALVDLQGKAFLSFMKQRQSWETIDDDLCPGPMQFIDEIPLILQGG